SNYLIPLEIICRHYVAGSLLDRVKEGKIKPEDLGFAAGHQVVYGEKLPRPFLEATTKLEEVDRNLDEKEAKSIAGLSDQEYQQILDTVMAIDEIVADEVAERLLIHVDGKKEFGYDEERQLMIIDTFGTLDEDRWWDADSYSVGVVDELSKEFVRQHYRETGYFDLLMEARKKGRPEPDIPALPVEVVEKVSLLYQEMFERITGESLR
ncbi:MAG: phosphoribosylaminoimidazolesuccinocarboxamide synthase, partial [Candidatus Methanomethylophilaceae archaeon]